MGTMMQLIGAALLVFGILSDVHGSGWAIFFGILLLLSDD
jgi:hypothetical protein